MDIKTTQQLSFFFISSMLSRRSQLIKTQLNSCSKIAVRGYYAVPKVAKKRFPTIGPIEPKLPTLDGSELFALWKEKQIKRLDSTGWKTKAVVGAQTQLNETYKQFLEEKEKFVSEENKNLPSGYSVYKADESDISDFWKFYPHTKKEFFEKIQKTQLPVKNFPLPLRQGDIVKLSFKTTDSTEPDMFGVVSSTSSQSINSSITVIMKYGDVESKAIVPLYSTDLHSLEIIDRMNNAGAEKVDMNLLPDFTELAEQFKKFELKRRFERMREYEAKMKQQKKD